VSIIPIYEPSRSASIAARVSLRKGCFEADLPIKDSAGECACSGVFLNLNTREDFKNFNKNEWMGSLGSKLGKRILSGEAEADPSLLIPVAVLSFADLKKHRYMFWFTFPALVLSTPAVLDRAPQELSEVYSYPILRKMFGGLVAARKSAKKRGCPMFIWVPSADGKDGEVKQLGDFAALDDEAKNRVEVIVMDPCALPNHPGWPVRNLLVLAFAKWRLKRLRVICMRETIGVAEKVATYPQVGNLLTRGSMVLDVLAPPGEAVAPLGGKGVTWGATGWELNKDGKMGPRFVDLSSHLDPAKLAESACHLNLRLMRWRALPTLDTGEYKVVVLFNHNIVVS
jgi:ubiquitin-like modifier-activating enzyme ATG7